MKRLGILLGFLFLILLMGTTPVMAENASTVTIKLGSTPGLYNGSYYSDGYNKKWVSSNPSIVSVTSYSGANCYLKANALGSCDIVFSCTYKKMEPVYKNGRWTTQYFIYPYSYIYHITVTASGETVPAEVIMKEKNITLIEGGSQVLNYSVKSLEEKNIFNYNKLSWFSSNPKVASVNTMGVVTAWAKGQAVITAITPEGIKDTCTVTVGNLTGYTQISTAQQLSDIRNNLSGNYILTKDIVFNDGDFKANGNFYNSGAGWVPIDGFTGILEGNGHYIDHLYSQGNHAGLFTNLKGAIRNLEIKNSTMKGTTYGGAFSAYCEGPSFKNCKSTNNIITAQTAGGFIGAAHSYSIFNNCTNTSQVTGSKAAGGIAGAGGFMDDFLLCLNKGNISILNNAVGDAGGVVGTGTSVSIYKFCTNQGDISGGGYTGGLIGKSAWGSRVYQCYNTGRVTGTGIGVCLGGIAGRAYFTYVADSYNLGGLQLINPGTKQGIMGGLLGNLTISGSSAGDNFLLIKNCINLGRLQIAGIGAPYVGSIIGTTVGDNNALFETLVKDCYFLNTTYDRPFGNMMLGKADNVMALSTASMKLSSSYGGFDFNQVWEFKTKAAYPTLRSQSNIVQIGVLEVPSSVKVAVRDYASSNLSWLAVNHATGYEIYRSTSKSKGYKLIATTSTSYYTNKKLDTGRTYYYKVRAYHTYSTKKIYSGFTTVKSIKTVLLAPQKSKATKVKSTSIKVTWQKVSGASGYEIYSSTSKKGKFTKIKTTKSLSYTKSGLKKGKTYYYKIRAYRVVGKTKVYSSWSTLTNKRL